MDAPAAAALLALAWAVTTGLLLLVHRGLRALPATAGARWSALGGLLVVLLSIWAWQRAILVPYGVAVPAASQLLSGDEPDYLLTAMSLARDGDLDVHDNIVRRDYLAFQDRPVGGAEFDVFNRISKGRLEERRVEWGEAQYMPHRPGTSIVLAPVFLLAGGNYRWWACFEIALLAAALLLAVALCFVRSGTPLPETVLALSIAALSPPVFFYSCQIYPEMLVGGLLATSAALLFLPGRPPIAGAFLLAAALWFSDRALPAVGLLALATVGRQEGRWRRAAALAVLSASALGFAAYCVHRFGVPWPVHHNERSGFSWNRTPVRLLQILFDRQQGWLWLFPAATLLPVIARAAWVRRDDRSRAARGITLGALALTLVLVAAFDDWQRGVNPRGRYYVVPQWLFAVVFLDWLRENRVARDAATRLSIALGALSLCTLPWLLQHPNWWFRRHHPLFGWPPLAPFYRLLPALPDGAPLLEWGKAAVWACGFLLPFLFLREEDAGAGRDES